MILHDMNRSWNPPEGHHLAEFGPHEGYLKAVYRQPVYFTGTTQVKGDHVVVVYLNDMGREVARTESLEPLPALEAHLKISGWFRFKNGFYIALQGIQEMLTCLRKS